MDDDANSHTFSATYVADDLTQAAAEAAARIAAQTIANQTPILPKALQIGSKQSRPVEGTIEYEAWIEVDALIRAWIINSIIPELQEAFIFIPTAKSLWESLKEKYGQLNGSLIYQLKRSISSLKQGDDSIATYVTKLQELWEELLTIDPPMECTCNTSRKILDKQERDLLIQFLIGLNERYEAAKEQILIMDPLPSMSKAYSSIIQVEKQKEIHIAAEHNAFLVENKKMQNKRFIDKKRLQIEKKNSICEYCKKKGHTKETCFKLNGIPPWYKEMVDKRNDFANSVS
ncbi:uncharacterized protein LOC127264801 [Andrographis paniculata]|uniref:uncharacterized protein LOC127264801 n=1 Tax=Andrographis paniculata TaxID=175694 RepID=UPI0021E71FC1|nr:uncharacterized protein LOC127264801 [Andrographis paniculata]